MIYGPVPFRSSIHRVLLLVAALTLIRAGKAADVPPAPRLPCEVSWIGNTWSGKSAWVPQDIDDLFVGPDGEILTNVPWEEGGGNVTRFDKVRILLGCFQRNDSCGVHLNAVVEDAVRFHGT